MSPAEKTLNLLRERLKDQLINADLPLENRLYVTIDPTALRETCRFLFRDVGGRYLVGIGMDERAHAGGFGVVHNFAFDRDHYCVSVKTRVPEHDPVVDSITPEVPAADWAEREFFDLVGIRCRDHPRPARLVLSDDWPEGIHPLRKDVPWNLMPPSNGKDGEPVMDDPPEGCTVLPVGPYHPALHEPAHFRLFVKGEQVKGVQYRGFMAHRGIEKIADSQLGYNDIPFLAERICGICGTVHSTSYSQCVEMAAGITVPPRARFIRTIMLELERVHSHLLWLGVAGHLVGFDTIFMQAWRVREPVMWLCEKITGNRKTYGMVYVGGVRRDIPRSLHDEIREVLTKIEEQLVEIRKAIIGDTCLEKRLRGVGVLSTEETREMCLVGPTARGNGVDIDVRRDHPYAAYGDVDFNVVTYDGCDVWSRTLVRIDETFESIRIVRQALSRMPDGPLRTEVQQEIPPLRVGLSAVEAARGEVTHYLVTGNENRPDRWRVRAPTYPNLQGVPLMLRDQQIADVPITIGSIDPCYSCTDRMEIVDTQSGNVEVVTREQIDLWSRERRRRR